MENYDEKMNYSFEPAPEEPTRPPLEQAKEEIRRSGRFVEEQPLGVVEHPVQQALQPPRDAAEIDWGAHHQAVGLDDLLDALIDAVIVENTAALAPAGSAVDTPPDELIADPEDLGLDLMLLELSRHLGQGGVGAALFVGATVDEQDFHTYLLLWAS